MTDTHGKSNGRIGTGGANEPLPRAFRHKGAVPRGGATPEIRLRAAHRGFQTVFLSSPEGGGRLAAVNAIRQPTATPFG